jgi:hypothetical protein
MLFILSMEKKRSLSAVQFAPLCVKRASVFFAMAAFSASTLIADCLSKITRRPQAKTFNKYVKSFS